MRIDGDFPGGNIVPERIESDRVTLHQDLRDTDRDWFYWYFRLRGAAGRTVRFEFTRSLAIGTRGPAISQDNGGSWQWLGRGCVRDNSFTHRFGADQDDVRLSFAMPYLLDDWRRFAAARSWLDCRTLAHTRGGRAVPLARVGDGALPIVVGARHHCCEMMPNYAIEGLIDFIHDDADAAALRERATVWIVPLMDLDGVEAGDQGKGRRPRDHGRDYLGESLYPEIAALRALLTRLRPAAVLDLHCPWIGGDHNEHIYVVGCADPRHAQQQRRFSAALEGARRGPLPFAASGYLPFGQAWNTPENSAGGRGLGNFAATLPDIRLAGALELPYATADHAEVNARTARAFGADLGRGLAAYLW